MTQQTDFTNTEVPVQAIPVQYIHTWNNGLELVRSRTNLILANFRPTLLKKIEIQGDNDAQGYEYDVAFELSPEQSVTLRVLGSDLEDLRTIRKRIAPALPPEYVIYPQGWQHLWPAALELAQSRPYLTEVGYRHMGWVEVEEGRWCYLLPGMDGGIVSYGLDPTYQLDANTLPPKWKRYGAGMVPLELDTEREQAEEALTRFFRLTTASIPLVTQVLAGPLSSWGVRAIPPLVHVHGESGGFKTTLALLALSLTGDFDSRRGGDSIPETWASTQNALMRRLYEGRDVTLLVDDYKAQRGEPTMLIQAYSDSTTRNRMGADQENRTSLLPRGLLLSTGEDTWEGYESTQARTLTVPLKSLVGDRDRMKEFLAEMSAVQEAGHAIFPRIGASWIRWLARLGPAQVADTLLKRGSEHVQAIYSQQDAHLRMANLLSVLFAVQDVIGQFIRQEFPGALAAYQRGVKASREEMLEGTVERAAEAASLAPYTWMVSEIQQALQQQAAHFTPRYAGETGTMGWRGESVGFYDDENVYLTKQATYAWAERQAAKRRKDLHFSWSAFCQGARDTLGPYPHAGKDQRISYQLHTKHISYARAVVLPRDLFPIGEITSIALEEAEETALDAWSDGETSA